MTKKTVDIFIRSMQKAAIVTKSTPWLVEDMGNQSLNVRYVGIKPKGDWTEVFSKDNNLLLKFIIDKQTARLEFYLANKPPFHLIMAQRFSEADKWEVLLGNLKNRLKKDKTAFLHHQDEADNLYRLLKSYLK